MRDYLAFYMVSLGTLFNIEKHKGFLHLIGYGGDIPITVEFGSNENREEFYLAIRTTTSLIGKNSKGLFVEVPLSEVKSITYIPPQSNAKLKQ
ncbi:MAG: hypothetical protein ACR65O_01665 [Methylomicrobium sp.]